MNYSHKYNHFLVYMAVINAVLGGLAVVSLGILIHKNPQLCFQYNCAKVNTVSTSSSNNAISQGPVVETAPDVMSKPVIASKVVSDSAEKQYIQNLVSNYKLSYISSSLQISQNTNQKVIEDTNKLNADLSLQASIPNQLAIITNEGCQVAVLPGYADYIKQNGEDRNSCIKYYSYLHKKSNDLPGMILQDKAQISSDRSELTSPLNNFCSLSQIPTSYKDYCLSLFN